jgi:DNA-binding transcriptional MerR regulator
VDKAPDAFRTISEVADDLDVPQHVLRFWETRFPQIKPMKRGGGRRYYRPDDVDLLRGIRHLLYGEGYTIRGVQRIFKEQGARFVIGAGRGEAVNLAGTGIAPGDPRDSDQPDDGMGDLGEVMEEEIQVSADAVYDTEPGYASEPGDTRAEDVHPPVARRPEPVAPPRRPEDAAGRPPPSVYAPPAAERARDPAPARAALSGEDVGRLQAVLAELLEMKRLLDQAR